MVSLSLAVRGHKTGEERRCAPKATHVLGSPLFLKLTEVSPLLRDVPLSTFVSVGSALEATETTLYPEMSALAVLVSTPASTDREQKRPRTTMAIRCAHIIHESRINRIHESTGWKSGVRTLSCPTSCPIHPIVPHIVSYIHPKMGALAVLMKVCSSCATRDFSCSVAMVHGSWLCVLGVRE